MNDDTQAVDELVADVRDSLKTNVREIEGLLKGLSKKDDPEGEGIDPVRDPFQIERLAKLHLLVLTALTDLP